jgi:hypothetical protein
MDMSLVWTPDRVWTIELGGTLQRARLIRSATGLALGDDRRLPVVPDAALRISLARQFRIADWRGHANVAVNYSGTSRLSFDPGLDRQMGDVLQGGLSTTLSRDHWQVGVQLANLFDSRADSFAFGNPFSANMSAQRTPLEPRRLTVTIAREF